MAHTLLLLLLSRPRKCRCAIAELKLLSEEKRREEIRSDGEGYRVRAPLLSSPVIINTDDEEEAEVQGQSPRTPTFQQSELLSVVINEWGGSCACVCWGVGLGGRAQTLHHHQGQHLIFDGDSAGTIVVAYS